MDEKEKQEEEERKKQERAKEAAKYCIKYNTIIDEKEQEFLRHQGQTSFGKMVLADYPTNPKYSIGKAKRKPLYEFTNTPGPIYSQDNTANLKYHSEQKWKIGDSKRPPLYTNERYDYYNYPYDETTDLGAIQKKWKHIPGGAATLDPRIKYDFNEKVPGPGRYEPNYTTQLKREPAYHLGLKLNSGSSLSLSTGTGINVAPWTLIKIRLISCQYIKVFLCIHFRRIRGKD